MAVGEKGMPGRRPKTSKPNTIHCCAQFGDLSGLKKCLEENPSLLNAKNDIMAQTPLHIAAGYNKVNIIKCLLEWNGPEKVELESKNMYGETPLHMAAKNGCSESAQLLLSNGASLEAKANNGMTPLHLSVWHAQQALECLIVKTLLEYNANCNIKDNEGLTPLNLISEGHGNDKLRELLDQHIQEQLKIKALKGCDEAKAMMTQFEASLSNIVGLHSLKLQLCEWAKGMILDEKRRALGLSIAARKVPHMAFLGNPGTGKTMVARVLGKLLHMVGILPTDKVTEVQRTDLVGEFVGHTGPKTRRKLQEAEGGILFVDEAYRLIPAQKSDDKDYGLEALEEIMSVMDNGKIVVVFAGYCEPMKRVITSNEGFCRRVTIFFNFDDFTPTELAQILHLKMNFQEQDDSLYGFKLHPLCTVEAVTDLICKGTTDIQRKEMNGGLIDSLLAKARGKLDFRLDFDCCDAEILVTITMEDLEEGLRTLSRLCDSASMSSSTSVGLRTCNIYCDCNLSCNIYTSRKTDSYGRKFYRCPRNRTQLDCNFFKWLDEDDDAKSSQSYEEKSMFEDFVKRMLADVKLQYRVLIEFHVVLIIILLMLVMLVWSIYLKM